MSDLNLIIFASLFNVSSRSEVKMEQSNGDFTANECRVVMKYLLLKGNSGKKSYDTSVTLSYKRPSYFTIKNWIVRFRTGHLSALTVFQICCRIPHYESSK
jgi:hypothetical protein